MRTYRINCTDNSDLIVATYAFRCSDDLDALDKATELCGANGVEVWDGARRVVWMHKGGAARFKIEGARSTDAAIARLLRCPAR